jgi:hypothetical protein
LLDTKYIKQIKQKTPKILGVFFVDILKLTCIILNVIVIKNSNFKNCFMERKFVIAKSSINDNIDDVFFHLFEDRDDILIKPFFTLNIKGDRDLSNVCKELSTLVKNNTKFKLETIVGLIIKTIGDDNNLFIFYPLNEEEMKKAYYLISYHSTKKAFL